MIVVLIHPPIQQVQNGDLHHRLVEVSSLILDDFDSDDFLRFEILAFDDLSESALAQDIEDKVAVFMVRFFGAEDVVYVKDVIAIFIIIPIVLDTLTRLCEHAARVARGLVLECWVADAVGGRKMCC